MSLVFIFSGLFLIFSMFDFVKYSSYFYKLYFIFICLCICLSFFVGDVIVFNVSINLFSFIAIIFLALNYNVRICFKDFIVVLIFSIVYYLSLKSSLDYLFSFNTLIVDLFVVILSLMYLKNFRLGFFLVTIVSGFMTVIGSIFSMNNFDFAVLNFNVVFNSVLMYVLTYIICNSMFCLFDKNKRGLFNEKSFNFNYNPADGCLLLFR